MDVKLQAFQYSSMEDGEGGLKGRESGVNAGEGEGKCDGELRMEKF